MTAARRDEPPHRRQVVTIRPHPQHARARVARIDREPLVGTAFAAAKRGGCRNGGQASASWTFAIRRAVRGVSSRRRRGGVDRSWPVQMNVCFCGNARKLPEVETHDRIGCMLLAVTDLGRSKHHECNLRNIPAIAAKQVPRQRNHSVYTKFALVALGVRPGDDSERSEA